MKFVIGLGVGLAAGFSAGIFVACVETLVRARN
jgi:hypothetical protein